MKKFVKKNIPNRLIPLKNDQILVECKCTCHHSPGEKHISACCYNGYKIISKIS